MRLISWVILLFMHITVQAQTLRVMTYNIRLDTESDGVNQWKYRAEKVYAVITKHKPDIFGVQEALHNQMMDLKNNLIEYEFVGVGRDDGKEKGEYSAIFYKKDKFEVLAQNTFWLSETPEAPGSKSWDAAITRVVTYAVLKEKISKKTFAFFNTHFDHIGKEARKNSANLIKQKIADLEGQYQNIPIVVSGDFNSEPTDAPYKTMIDGSVVVLIDSTPIESETGTFCSFVVNSIKCRTIDYIFHTAHWKSMKYKVIQDNDGTHYPSDHLPVLVLLKLKK